MLSNAHCLRFQMYFSASKLTNIMCGRPKIAENIGIWKQKRFGRIHKCTFVLIIKKYIFLLNFFSTRACVDKRYTKHNVSILERSRDEFWCKCVEKLFLLNCCAYYTIMDNTMKPVSDGYKVRIINSNVKRVGGTLISIDCEPFCVRIVSKYQHTSKNMPD